MRDEWESVEGSGKRGVGFHFLGAILNTFLMIGVVVFNLITFHTLSHGGPGLGYLRAEARRGIISLFMNSKFERINCKDYLPILSRTPPTPSKSSKSTAKASGLYLCPL